MRSRRGDERVKNDILEKQGIYVNLRQRLLKQMPRTNVDEIFAQGDDTLTALYDKYNAGLSKKMRLHTDRILASNAMYCALSQELGKETAMQLMEECYYPVSEKMGKKVDRLTRLPGMSRLFVKLFGVVGRKMFGETAGFHQRDFESRKGMTKFDITECPYHKLCRLCGSEELTHVFCESDVYMYGSLKKVEFKRTQTLGAGGECCDFLMQVRGR